MGLETANSMPLLVLLLTVQETSTWQIGALIIVFKNLLVMGCSLHRGESSGSGNGQFSNPGQVAVDSSGNVYVADAANNRVQKFTSDGVFITSWGGFFNPIGVAVDNSGNVCVLDSYNSRVAKFTSSGVFITSWGTSSAGWCDAVDSSGNVYVVEPYINRVEKFTSTGVLITSWGGIWFR